MSVNHMVFTRTVNSAVQICAFVDQDQAENTDKVHLSSLSVSFNESDNGLPVGNEFNRISKIEDRMISEFERFGGIHIGHIITKGAMRTWFRSSQKPPTELEIKTGLFKKEKFEVTTYSDPDWSIGNAEVKPTPLEQALSTNSPLHDALNKNGDRAEAVRKVDFCAFFNTRPNAETFGAAAIQQGFQIGEVWEAEGSFGIEFTKEMDVLPDHMAERCVQLQELVEQFKGDFDGWACPIVTD